MNRNSPYELPCTSFEELMLAQTSPQYPCDIWLRIRLSGIPDRNVLNESMRHWLARHPLLHARLSKHFFGHRWSMHASPDQSNSFPIDWIESDLALGESWPEGKPFDLAAGRALHAFLRFDDSTRSSELVLQFHHALADGLGIISAVHDLFSIYDTVASNKQLSDQTRSLKSLAQRNRFGLNLLKLIQLVPKQLVGFAGVRQFLMRKPVAVVPHTLPTSAVHSAHSVSLDFNKSRIELLRNTAKSKGVSLNELLAAAIFQAIHRFRFENGWSISSEWMRMMVPVNMRTQNDTRNQSACNIVSAIFLDRTPEQSLQPSLLKTIHDEMELIKNNRLAFMFLLSIWIRKVFSIGRFNPKRLRRCETSFVFSNLGKIFLKSPLKGRDGKIVAHDLTIDDFEILAPLNPFMVAAFTNVQYRDFMRLTLRYDERILSREQAARICQCVDQTLENHCTIREGFQ